MNEFVARLDRDLFFRFVTGYTARFGVKDEVQIIEFFIKYLRDGRLPDWVK
jgi:hypothetical protein